MLRNHHVDGLLGVVEIERIVLLLFVARDFPQICIQSSTLVSSLTGVVGFMSFIVSGTRVVSGVAAYPIDI